MTKKLATVFKNNHIYLIGAFTIFSLFGIILILLGAITKNINWEYGSIAILVISLIIALITIVFSIFAVIDAVKERKNNKAKNK